MSAIPAAVPAADFITILKSAGPRLTKVFDAGEVIPYDQAKSFSVEAMDVASLADLSRVLRYLEPKPLRCVIRGQFKGDAAAQSILPPTRPGQYQRVNDLFDEVPHHWAMFDIDHYTPMLWDPAENPLEAIQEFVADKLPPEFHRASFHWQLSSSAGRTPGMLKAHIWFWLDTPYTGPQLHAWVRAHDLPIDVAPLRRVQVHYTAAPIFQNGALDPIKDKRSGLHHDTAASVALHIPSELLAAAEERTHDGDAFELPDPTQKSGIIGAFCREYPISRVIHELLSEEFAFEEGSDRRVTWLNSGGGAPGGCFVTDNDWYLGNTHNTDPLDGRLANAWDLVRQYRFGDKDAGLDINDRALAGGAPGLPSHAAMRAWVETLPDVQGTAAVVAQSERDGFLEGISGAINETILRTVVLPPIARARLSRTDRDILVAALLSRMRDLTGVRNLGAVFARRLLREAGREGDGTEAPFWAVPIVYVTNGDQFFNLDSKETMSKQGFDFSYNRFMGPFISDDGVIPAASRHACDVWHIPTVSNVAYNPTLARTFEMSGRMFANTYSDANIPTVPPVLTDSEAEAIRLVEAHTEKILPDARERALFMDFLAHNVQFPGKKVRWAVFLHGVPGAGKTFFYQLLAATMGPDNVRPLNAETLLNSDFNEWANEAAVVGIEEIKVPKTSPREADNKLKALISNNDIDIHPKGKKSYVVVNVTNYLIFSNFPDGLPMTSDDRRYMALRAAISVAEAKDLVLTGYFVRLFGALENNAGALRKWLLERKLSPEFSANGQAPWTTEKTRVIELCKADVQLALEEKMAEGGRGVTPLVISTAHLTQAVKDKTGDKIWTNKLQKTLEDAGFEKFGRAKWDGDMRTLYVSSAFVSSLPEEPEAAKAILRKILDASTEDTDFLD